MDSQSNSMKAKSLGVLAVKFLNLYDREEGHLIGLDDAAGKLEVENRRIYDVVNILKSIGLVAKVGKSQFKWCGFEEVPSTLNVLKEEGMEEKLAIIPYARVLQAEEIEESLKLASNDQENSQSSKPDNKRENSFTHLAQKFLKLFLCSNNDDLVITLEQVRDALFQGTKLIKKTHQERRVYDIVNVFSSINLIKKTQTETRKPAYMWLGYKPIPKKKLPFIHAKKRKFGTETNGREMHLHEMDFHSNKTKPHSLEDLASSFLKLYDREDVCLIGLDDVAKRLGVGSRRIYDIVNILKSTGLVGKAGAKQFWWYGFGEVLRTLNDLKVEGMQEKLAIVPYVSKSEMVEVMQENLAIVPYVTKWDNGQENPKHGSKKETSTCHLAQKFLKLFLCSDIDDLTITHKEATDALFKDVNLIRKTQERRVYDIGNVFSSMNLIEKTQIGIKKPAYRWLGHIPISEKKLISASTSLCDRIKPKKRKNETNNNDKITKQKKMLELNASEEDPSLL